MVESISPTYYAADTEWVEEYVLTGVDFDVIPSDAIGIMAVSNERPLAYRYDNTAYHLFNIVEKSDSSMRLSTRQTTILTRNNYLGAIVSNDRKTVYWVNRTNPL